VPLFTLLCTRGPLDFVTIANAFRPIDCLKLGDNVVDLRVRVQPRSSAPSIIDAAHVSSAISGHWHIAITKLNIEPTFSLCLQT
jgi:hypothetical protein